MPGTLIICATPIGNLADAPPRLGEALASADVVYAEDTRRTAVLLAHLGVSTPSRSFFVGNEEDRATELADHLAAGKTVALVTDAGTPAISDPGVRAIQAAVDVGARVTAVPGPSAVTMALAVSGFSGDRFVFEGFLPRKGKARADRVAALAGEDRTIVLFAATKRVDRDLSDLAAVMDPERPVVVCRELTKLHEEIWRGSIAAAAAQWAEIEPKGEFTIVIAPQRRREASIEDALAAVDVEVAGGSSLSSAVKDVAESLGVSRRALYEEAIKRR